MNEQSGMMNVDVDVDVVLTGSSACYSGSLLSFIVIVYPLSASSSSGQCTVVNSRVEDGRWKVVSRE